MSIVLDCSAAMAFCFDDERDDASVALLADIARRGAVVPALWALEVGNVLLAAERRSRLSAARVSRLLSLLHSLPLEVENEPDPIGLVALARQTNLTLYDATYLALAQRRGLPLATRDRALRRAAAAVGVVLVG
jgi:predicted nucleic acid-binding protein